MAKRKSDESQTDGKPLRANGTKTAPPLVVGIGASAGGFEAVGDLLTSLEDHGPEGIAIVLVQHLQSSSADQLNELLAKSTSMSIKTLKRRSTIKSGTVYIAPANSLLSIESGTIRVEQLPAVQSSPTAIDHFFNALSNDQKSNAIGIVLSGNGTDGALGLKAISDAGGLTIAQDEESAKHESMPRNAAATGVADYVLPPKEITNEIASYARYIASSLKSNRSEKLQTDVEAAIPEIAEVLLKVTNHNFQHYKTNTLRRRIIRRMQVLRVSNASDYLARLKDDNDEAGTLFRELLIGPSESISSHKELFRTADSKCRISQRKGTGAEQTEASQRNHGDQSAGILFETEKGGANIVGSRAFDLPNQRSNELVPVMQRIVLDEFAPKSVVIDEEGQILCASGNIEKYLTVTGGNFQNNVVKMARKGLRIGLRTALSEANEHKRRVVHEDLSVRVDNAVQRVMVTVQPMPQLGNDEELLLIVFHDIGPPLSQKTGGDSSEGTGDLIELGASGNPSAITPADRDSDKIIEQLERELETTRNSLERTMQEMESTNEELKSSNEELVSMNEELQSANEELETSKEEVQASIRTIVQSKDDLENLLSSTQIATIFLDDDLTIRGFTPAMKQIYGIIETDIGRPLSQLMPLTDEMPDFPSVDAVNKGQLVEDTVTTHSGNSFIRRVLPYANSEGNRDGVVVTFTDVSELLARDELLRRSLEAAKMDAFEVDLETRKATRKGALSEVIGLDSTDSFGDYVKRIHPTDRKKFEQSIADCTPQQPAYVCDYRFRGSNGKYLWLRDDAETIFDGQGEPVRIVGSCRNISKRKRTELALLSRERQMRTIADALPPLIAFVDTELRYQFANEAYIKQFGVRVDDIIGQRIVDVVGKQAFDSIQPHLEKAFAGEQLTYEIELRNHVDNQLAVKEVTYIPETNDGGEVIGCHVLAVDITERKQFERMLAESETQLRQVIDNQLPFVTLIDQTGTVTEINASAADASGLPRDHFIGSKFWETKNWQYDPAIAEQIERDVKRALAGELIRYDIETELDEQRVAIDFMLAPVNQADGTVERVIASGVDISDRKQSQLLASAAFDHLQLALEAGRLGTWEWEISTNTVNWSDSSFEMFGVEPDQFGGSFNDFTELIHVDDQPAVGLEIEQVLNGEKDSYEIECRCVRPSDSQTIWILARATVSRDSDGNPLKLIGVVTDITNRKSTEVELAAAKLRLELAMDVSGVAAWSWNFESNGVNSNENLQRLYGFGEHESPSFDDFVNRMEESARSRVEAAVKDSLENGVDFEEEYRVLLPTGQTRWLRAFGRVVTSKEGAVEHFTGVVYDLTDRKQHELELANREERLAMALKAGGMAAWEWRPTETFWTPELCELMQISPDETPSPELFFKHVHPDDIEALKASWEKAASGEQSYDHEFRVLRPDGEIRWIVGTGEVDYNDDGTVKRIYGLNWDNTPEHLAAESLRESERLAMAASQSKSEFLANMSHEIRTPMSAIIGYADILARHLKDPDDLNCVSIIRRNGNFLLDIINDILDISKIEAGKIELSQQVFRLDRLVADVRSLMQVRAVEKLIDLNVEIEGSIPQEIKSDPKRLKQILVNLIGNAIKFTESGSVKLVVRQLGDGDKSRIQFEVSDTGIGMTAEQQSRLFQPFSQGDSSVARRFGGTGLGLAISQRLAKMLGGQISVESEPGTGSTFSLSIVVGHVKKSLMIGMKNWDVAPTKLPPSEIDKVQLEAKILVVDDRREIRFIAQHFIEGAGGQVVTGENGQEAIDAVEAAESDGQPFDLVVIDMQMPVLDGYEATRRLRKSGFAKPIIALTAHAMEGDRDECLKAGCTDYMAKPLDGPAFTKLLDGYLKNRSNGSEKSHFKILVVDDAEHARDALSTLLSLNGHVVRGAADGRSAIELAKSFEPEIVLLDLGLPDMSGFDAFEQLRQITALSETKFIATTGHDNSNETLATGFHHHIVKPVDVDALDEWLKGS